jgi:hypothetical protein
MEGFECSVNQTTGALTAMTNLGANVGVYFPRAIISRHKIVNADFNSTTATAGSCSNSYFGG